VRFFDASALVKRYVRERDSMRVRRLLSAGDVAIGRLSEMEVVSAFARLARTGASRAGSAIEP
jgi:predicted nucleic acid-binding protein